MRGFNVLRVPPNALLKRLGVVRFLRRDGRDIPLSEAFEKANRCEGLSALRRGQAQSESDIHCVN
ncbi:MAG: hypothetical protein ABJ275_01755 [Maricaulaceae bacterium]